MVTAGEDTDGKAIAQLLTTYRIKRVPVVRDGKIVGIVSRADLVRAMLRDPAPTVSSTQPGLIGEVVTRLDERFWHHVEPRPSEPAGATAADGSAPLAQDFRALVADFKHQETQQRKEERRLAAERLRHRVAELIDPHISETFWRSLLHQALQACEHGGTEFMLLRFPSQLYSDGGRDINSTEPGWPATLRGEAAELYLRWERDLKAHGFHLAARILDFPGGKPGDVGLLIVWGT